MIFAVASRCLARCAHLSTHGGVGTKSKLSGQQQLQQHTIRRGLSSAFKTTPGTRKSAAVGVVEEWEVEGPTAPKVDRNCVVNSHTEWDPLEEVIVGRVDDATIPEWHVSGKAVWPAKHWNMYKNSAGQSFPKGLEQKGGTDGREREREGEREGERERRGCNVFY